MYAECMSIVSGSASPPMNAAILLHEAVDGVCRERAARVSPKVRAVATGTAARTVGYVDGEGHLVRYFLKNY